MLVSPTEPSAFGVLGHRSLKPEEYGVDFLWWIPRIKRFGGVQRKEIKDLIASNRDGRLAKELGQMRELGFAAVVIEGRLHWVNGHIVIDSYTKMSRENYNGVLLALQSQNVMVLHTEAHSSTVETVTWCESWSNKDGHSSLTTRPGPPTNSWGMHSNKDYGLWVLQSFPGIGRELAERVYEHFGRVPLKVDVTEEELCQVKGMGKVKAKRMRQALGE